MLGAGNTEEADVPSTLGSVQSCVYSHPLVCWWPWSYPSLWALETSRFSLNLAYKDKIKLEVRKAEVKRKHLRVPFLPPSDAYVRSFLYLLYTLIELYYTKSLSDQASSLAPDWILLLRGPRIPVSLRDSTTTFHWPGEFHELSVGKQSEATFTFTFHSGKLNIMMSLNH